MVTHTSPFLSTAIPPVIPPRATRSTVFVSGSIRATAVSRSLPIQTRSERSRSPSVHRGSRRSAAGFEEPCHLRRSDARGRSPRSSPRHRCRRPRRPSATRHRSEPATLFVSGSIRTTLSPSSFTTQMPSAALSPTARNRGTALSGRVVIDGDLDGIGRQVLRVVPKHEVAIGVGEPDRVELDDDRLRVAGRERDLDRFGGGVDRHDLRSAWTAEAVRDPDGALACRNPGGDAERGLRRRYLAGLRIDPVDGRVPLVDHPEVPVLADRDARGILTDTYRLVERVRARVDPSDRVR